MPGSVHIDLFSSLDGVMQAPGRVDEDPSGGFAFGGWQARFEDDVVGERVIAGIRAMDALLLGRRTYEIFAGYWPRISGAGPAGEIARLFNALPKYVASRGDRPLGWNNSHLLGLDLGREIAALRGRHTEVHVVGSIDLARTLVAEPVLAGSTRLTSGQHAVVLTTDQLPSGLFSLTAVPDPDLPTRVVLCLLCLTPFLASLGIRPAADPPPDGRRDRPDRRVRTVLPP